MSVLPDEIREVLDNGVPLMIATCSADGVPNISIASQAYYVDAEHVALSFQFFNKTVRNVRENPQATILLNDPARQRRWIVEAEYERSETEGPVFDEMDMQIEAIASATGMKGIFKLRAADVYRVRNVRCISSNARRE